MILWMKTEEMALGELLERLRTVTQSIDEIMQLDSSPLRAADITPELRRQFAFLSGNTLTVSASLLPPFISCLPAYLFISTPLNAYLSSPTSEQRLY
ncbi:putative guanine nucleotide exchange factor MCF2L2 [Larimichthys crocea]|uniref:Uncharacterized protein n=1 Tax=Larimichthys crocea TaxID=215358 RepID=A0ACD3QIT1_LARCR|nr:putative guanine nucleotide exchange factor MCF2L2 [Larimichthys crocea]